MRLLVDVDAVSKLAHWGLIEELPALSGVPLAQCATLNSVVHRARRAMDKPDGKLFHTAVAAGRACAAIRQMVEPAMTDFAPLPALQDIAAVDAGEAVLLSVLHRDASVLLLSGDKRALRALASLALELRHCFAGRIIVVEQIVLTALDRHGIEWLRERLCPHRDLDKAVGSALGSRCDAPEASVREGLRSYIGEVAESCDPSLLASVPLDVPGEDFGVD